MSVLLGCREPSLLRGQTGLVVWLPTLQRPASRALLRRSHASFEEASAPPPGVPSEACGADRSSAAEATRRRLEDAAAARASEEAERATQRHQRRDYRPGRATEAERAARLAEMETSAAQHEEARWARVARQEAKEAKEEAEQAGRHHADAATFLAAASKDVYGTGSGGGGTLADSVGRRKFLNERGPGAGGGAAFRRH